MQMLVFEFRSIAWEVGMGLADNLETYGVSTCSITIYNGLSETLAKDMNYFHVGRNRELTKFCEVPHDKA